MKFNTGWRHCTIFHLTENNGSVRSCAAHFIPCDLIFLLCPLMYGLVCLDSVHQQQETCPLMYRILQNDQNIIHPFSNKAATRTGCFPNDNYNGLLKIKMNGPQRTAVSRK